MTTLDLINRAHELWFAEHGPLPDASVPNLWHYTTAQGLTGILESCSVFGSHVRYLNDASEAKHALKFAAELLGGLPAEGALGLDRDRLQRYGSFFFDHADVLWKEDAYVTSFCENGDLLSQWRAYAMGGFAILFAPLYSSGERDFLLRNRAIWKTTIRKVIYANEEKKNTLLKILAAGIKATEKADGDRGLENMIATVTSMQLQMWIHTAKHSGFEHEQEWRIISYMGPHSEPLKASDGFRTRLASGQLVPCIRLTPAQGKLLPILGVKCGPNESRKFTEKAVCLLLSSHLYPTDRVSTSAIPFRSRY